MQSVWGRLQEGGCRLAAAGALWAGRWRACFWRERFWGLSCKGKCELPGEFEGEFLA